MSACWEKIHVIVCHIKEKAPHCGKKEEHFHRWHLCRGRSISCLSGAAQKWSSQHGKGPKISSLSMFLGFTLPYENSHFTTLFVVVPLGAEHKPSSLSLPHQATASNPLIISTALSSLMLINTFPAQGLQDQRKYSLCGEC